MRALPTIGLRVEMPLDLGDIDPASHALLRLATMIETGNRAAGDRWIIFIDDSTHSIRLVPQP